MIGSCKQFVAMSTQREGVVLVTDDGQVSSVQIYRENDTRDNWCRSCILIENVRLKLIGAFDLSLQITFYYTCITCENNA